LIKYFKILLINRPILSSASFNIRKGSKITIMGQNGSGKSTILKLINGSLKINEGAVNIQPNITLSTASQVMPMECRDMTVLEFFVHHLHGNSAGIQSRIASVLQTVELPSLIGETNNRIIRSFSGGQQARLLLASALIVEADVLLLGKPVY
jgi:ATPase subunit of ABC transporter with duplicated ATPase domains